MIGGFPRDTRKSSILEQVTSALHKLNVYSLTDETPFCTGPRRSSALLPFRVRADEDHAAARDRMHKVISAFAKEDIMVVEHGKKMWAGASKSKSEREVSGHCALVRAVAHRQLPVAIKDMDCDYTLGKSLGRRLLGRLVLRPASQH